MADAVPISDIVFADHGQRPAGTGRCWQVVAGLGHAGWVGITEYPDLADCEAAARGRAAGPGTSWLIRGLSGLPQRALPQRPMVELRVLAVYNSAQVAHCRSVEDLLVPELERQGASVSRQYEIVIGPARPSILMLTGWDSLAHLHDGRRSLDASPAQARKRAEDLACFGRVIDEGHQQFILRNPGEANG